MVKPFNFCPDFQKRPYGNHVWPHPHQQKRLKKKRTKVQHRVVDHLLVVEDDHPVFNFIFYCASIWFHLSHTHTHAHTHTHTHTLSLSLSFHTYIFVSHKYTHYLTHTHTSIALTYTLSLTHTQSLSHALPHAFDFNLFSSFHF